MQDDQQTMNTGGVKKIVKKKYIYEQKDYEQLGNIYIFIRLNIDRHIQIQSVYYNTNNADIHLKYSHRKLNKKNKSFVR